MVGEYFMENKKVNWNELIENFMAHSRPFTKDEIEKHSLIIKKNSVVKRKLYKI
ncbi:hypothetical protein D3C86_1999310 [compost metagenome]